MREQPERHVQPIDFVVIVDGYRPTESTQMRQVFHIQILIEFVECVNRISMD